MCSPVQIAMNKDSSNIGPREWIALAKTLHNKRDLYDAFLIGERAEIECASPAS